MPRPQATSSDEQLIQVKAGRRNAAEDGHFLPRDAVMTTSIEPEPNAYLFDARGVARRFRHAAIFGALGALEPGETMRFVNDHDPLPLLAQLRQRFGPHVQIEYRQRDAGAIVIDFGIVA